jgi:hypothetical protein
MSEDAARDAPDEESPLSAEPTGPHGCLTALLVGVGLLIAGGLGLAWVVTLEPSLVPSSLAADLGRALGYALILGVPSALVALLLRDERFALWRGFGLTLALAGAHAGMLGVLLAADRALPHPGVPGVVPPLVSLLFGAAVVLAGRRRFLGRPMVAPVLFGVGMGLLVSVAWVIVGVLGTLSEALLALLEAVSSGLVSAALLASLFFYDGEMPARRPFWSAVLVGVTLAALQNGLLAVRGYWLQGSMFSAIWPESC